MDQDFSPVQHTIVLRRVDPEKNAARFYVLTLERGLFFDDELAPAGCFCRGRPSLQLQPR
ncbi:MAG: hypothetical protein K0R61_4911 [Microvirga sp.]|nr:hypothetical protein [Microvirga sp.]